MLMLLVSFKLYSNIISVYSTDHCWFNDKGHLFSATMGVSVIDTVVFCWRFCVPISLNLADANLPHTAKEYTLC